MKLFILDILHSEFNIRYSTFLVDYWKLISLARIIEYLMRINRIILSALIASTTYTAHAQHEVKVRGRVMDSWRNYPVANVRIEGISFRTVSDSAGYFYIFLSDSNLRVSFEKQGYFPVEVTIGEIINTKLVSIHPILKTDTITVIATKPVISELDISSSITKITGEDFIHKTDLAELLAHQGAVLVKSYGGDEAVKSISMRGMGAEQTLISLDGISLNSSQTGIVDLNHYFLDAISEIEIYRGGYSTLFGNSAIGGVVNITLKPPDRSGLRFSLEQGAYGFNKLAGNIAFKTSKIIHQLNFIRNYSSNTYRFKIDGDKGRRSNSDFSKIGLNYLSYWSPSDRNSILFHFLYYRDFQGVPRPMNISRAYQGLARMGEQEWIMRANWVHKWSQAIQAKSQVYLRRDWMDYRDSDIDLTSNHMNESAGLLLKTIITLNPAIQLHTGIDASSSRIKSSDTGYHDRQQSSMYFLVTWLLWQKENNMLNLSLAAREEFYSGMGSVFLPRTGINIILNDWRFFISAGQNFRVPTLNELYWQPGGDPNLQSEKSIAYECGTGYSWRGVINGEMNLSLYYMNLHKMIRWYPTDTGLWRPKNLDKVVSKGIEIQIKFNLLQELVKANIDYKYGLSKLLETTAIDREIVGNRLAYQPSTKLNLGIEIIYNKIRLGLEADYMSFRYTTLANLNDQILPSATVYDLSIDYTFDWRLIKVMIYGKINNLFQKEYQYIANYPLPLQPWKLGFQVELPNLELLTF